MISSKPIRRLLNAMRQSYASDLDLVARVEEIASGTGDELDEDAAAAALCQTSALAFSTRHADPIVDNIVQSSRSTCRLGLLAVRILEAFDGVSRSLGTERFLRAVKSRLEGIDLEARLKNLIQSWAMYTVVRNDPILDRSYITRALALAQSVLDDPASPGLPSIRQWGNDTLFMFRLSVCLSLSGRHESAQAAHYLTLALKQRPDAAAAWQSKGVELEETDSDQAISAFERAYRLDPKDELTCARLAGLYAARGDLRQAEKLLEDAISQTGGTLVLYLQKAILDWHRRELWEALETLGKALECRREGCFLDDVNEPCARLWIGHVLEEVGLFPNAVDEYRAVIPSSERVVACEPVLASSRLVGLLCRMGNRPAAAAELKRYLEIESQRLPVCPISVLTEDFPGVCDRFLQQADLIKACDAGHLPAYTGQHLLDRYLISLTGAAMTALVQQNISSGMAAASLSGIARLWQLYGQRLRDNGLTEQFAKSQLLAMRRQIEQLPRRDRILREFCLSLVQYEVRLGTTSERAFARAMVKNLKGLWQSARQAERRGEVQDLRDMLQTDLYVHVVETRSRRWFKAEPVSRVHCCMELYKGQRMASKLLDPDNAGTPEDRQRWQRYVEALPAKADSAIIDLRAYARGLPENGVAMSFYFLHRDPLPDQLIALIVRRHHRPILRVIEGNEAMKRWDAFQQAGRRLQDCHERFALSHKGDPSLGLKFCEFIGEAVDPADPPRGSALAKRISQWQAAQLETAGQAVLQGIIDVDELRGRHLVVSPSPEMYAVPFGLLRVGGAFLCDITEGITVTPILSLRALTGQRHALARNGLVMCLDSSRWEADAQHRAGLLPHLDRSIMERDLAQFIGKPEGCYSTWMQLLTERRYVHLIGHNDPRLLSQPLADIPSLAQYARWLYEAPYTLNIDLLALEACWAGTLTDPDDLMGLFVSFMASGVKKIIASPYPVVPAQTSGRFFDTLYRTASWLGNGQSPQDIARSIKDVAGKLRDRDSSIMESSYDDQIPTLWGAYQVYAAY